LSDEDADVAIWVEVGSEEVTIEGRVRRGRRRREGREVVGVEERTGYFGFVRGC
jgi:hypothetical protein